MKRVVRYRVNFDGKAVSAAAFFAGMAFFLCVLRFYVFGNADEAKGGTLFFGAALPLILLGAYMLLLRLVRVDIPLIFGGLIGLYCLCVTVVNFSGGPGWMNLVELLLCILCIAAMVMSLTGYFKGKWYLAAAFLAAAVARFFFRDFMGYFDPLEPVKALYDAAVLCGLLSFSCLWVGMKSRPVRKNAERA